jgi:hypothetical protein
MKNIGFFVRHFTERGTEVAVYDYAKYNEEILHNKSYIICFTKQTLEKISYQKFNARFTIIEINNICEIKNVIDNYNIDFFYTLTHGGNDMYQFENKNIWNNCKTIKHCVFDTKFPESDFYLSISDYLNEKNNTNVPVIPHIVSLEKDQNNKNLRNELNIPNDAIVIGRYGGFTEFNIIDTHQAIQEFLELNNNNNKKNIYFLFMNTQIFYRHPRIIYLKKNINLTYKNKFINTCDAMIHARWEGETFGLSIAEFSINNKPIITCPSGDLEHIKILGEKSILYRSKEELLNIFNNITTLIKSRNDWNAYRHYSPSNIMKLFNNIFESINTKNIENNLKNDIIFVTAFKDIGRGNWQTLCPRKNEEYFEYFLNLTNNIEYTLIVYLDINIKNELLNKYKFKNNIVFLDLNSVDTFYDKYLFQDNIIMNSTEYKSKIPLTRQNNPEHLYSAYNLINHSKVNFIHNTKSLFPNYEYYSWIDFGYVREASNCPKNINIEKLSKKINYHCLEVPDLNNKITENDMLRSDTIFITGSSFIVHNDLVDKFQCIYENKLLEWHKKMITDDDQSLILQLYYDNPEIFELKLNNKWFSLYNLF